MNNNVLFLPIRTGLADKKMKSHLYYTDDSQFDVLAITNLGQLNVGYNEIEMLDESAENVRTAIAGKM